MNMKTDDEMYSSVLERLEEYERNKRRRNTILKRSAAIISGAAAVIAIGVFSDIMKAPEKPAAEKTGIVEEMSIITSLTAVTTSTNKTETSVITSETTTLAVSTSTNTEITTTNTNNQSVALKKEDSTTVTVASTSFTSSVSEIIQTETSLVTQQTTTEVHTEIITTTAQTEVTTQTSTTTEKACATNVSDADKYLRNNFYTIVVPESEKIYTMRFTNVDERIGEKIDTFVINPKEKSVAVPETITADMYAINGISSDFAVGIRFDIYDNTYLFIDNDYSPANLGDFLKDTSFMNETVFDIASKKAKYKDPFDKQYPVNAEKVFSFFEENMEAPAVNEDTIIGMTKMYVYFDYGTIGINNNFYVSSEGYITFKLMGNNFEFFIGKENVNKLVDELLT